MAGGFGMGIHPCTDSATRRRVSFEFPPIQMGTGSWVGLGSARTPRALKCLPSWSTTSPVHVLRITAIDSSNSSLRSSKSTPRAAYSGFR